jgi:hypothetical protein
MVWRIIKIILKVLVIMETVVIAIAQQQIVQIVTVTVVIYNVINVYLTVLIHHNVPIVQD